MTLQQVNRNLVQTSKQKNNDNHCEKRKVPPRIARRPWEWPADEDWSQKNPSRPPLT